MRSIAILGSTGSIGLQTLEVAETLPDDIHVQALANRSNTDIIDQALRFGVSHVGIADEKVAEQAERILAPEGITVFAGPDAAERIAALPVHMVVNGLDGLQGIGPSVAALTQGSLLALANKESLVAGSQLLAHAVPDAMERIIPVDSEHSALAQCLRAGRAEEVNRLVLTASGGPFRGRSREDLRAVTVRDVLAHPTWDMGALVTVNSASLANKGLEVIEAHVLFGVPFDRIDVVVHPQSIVHSMVEFVDGSTIAQLAPPDMRSAIQFALTWPERKAIAPVAMDWTTAQTLTFEAPDLDTFPMLDLFIQAGQRGASAPIVVTAANEVAVEALLHRHLPFLAIADIVRQTQEQIPITPVHDVHDVYAVDAHAREVANRFVEQWQ